MIDKRRIVGIECHYRGPFNPDTATLITDAGGRIETSVLYETAVRAMGWKPEDLLDPYGHDAKKLMEINGPAQEEPKSNFCDKCGAFDEIDWKCEHQR